MAASVALRRGSTAYHTTQPYPDATASAALQLRGNGVSMRIDSEPNLKSLISTAFAASILPWKSGALPAGLEPTLYGLEDRCFIH